MKKYLLLVMAVAAISPPLWAEVEEVPSLQVGENLVPRSVYSKIRITPGTPEREESYPSLKVGAYEVSRTTYNKIRITAGTPEQRDTYAVLKVGSNTVRRSLYSKIQVEADKDRYTLVSNDAATAPNLTYKFASSPRITVGEQTDITPAVGGSFTLYSDLPTASQTAAYATAQPITYSFADAPRVTVGTHTDIIPAVSTSYTLVSNDPDNYAHLTHSVDEHPQILLATDYKDVMTAIESATAEAAGGLSYHPGAQILRATWAESREVVVVDPNGRILLRGKLGGEDASMSVRALPTGVYIAAAREKEGYVALKFLKQ